MFVKNFKSFIGTSSKCSLPSCKLQGIFMVHWSLFRDIDRTFLEEMTLFYVGWVFKEIGQSPL